LQGLSQYTGFRSSAVLRLVGSTILIPEPTLCTRTRGDIDDNDLAVLSGSTTRSSYNN